MTKIKALGLSLFVALMSANVFGQELNQIRVAYINTSEILDAYPEKENATQQLITLSDNYKSELELMENEYNKKYSDYITYQASLAENIKLRRMQELTELENKIQNFMELAQKDIEMQEQDMLKPLKERIKDAVRAVGIEQNFTVIYDLANPGIAFVSPNAIDATPYVKQKLGIR
ncbi:MAG: OmpH family outer membrane protein [Fermentimonas sp.]|jgi:outer membrane protein